ncbi:hypothetical protein AB6D86_23405 [Vibrio splendidus]|uniref:hypothetical protein n=1 Tax=Vibrio sp. 624788 TaxID=1234362 RepID=UPI0002E5D959|nr:hypothetical protein [Vibrio sp. 624788]
MLGSMTSLTGGGGLQGGSAGPSTATSTSNTTNNSGFSAASYNFGSNNGIPSWALIAGAVAVGLYVYKSKK